MKKSEFLFCFRSDYKTERLILIKICDRPVEKCFYPVSVINKRNEVYEQPHKPGYKTFKMDMMRQITNGSISSDYGHCTQILIMKRL